MSHQETAMILWTSASNPDVTRNWNFLNIRMLFCLHREEEGEPACLGLGVYHSKGWDMWVCEEHAAWYIEDDACYMSTFWREIEAGCGRLAARGLPVPPLPIQAQLAEVDEEEETQDLDDQVEEERAEERCAKETEAQAMPQQEEQDPEIEGEINCLLDRWQQVEARHRRLISRGVSLPPLPIRVLVEDEGDQVEEEPIQLPQAEDSSKEENIPRCQYRKGKGLMNPTCGGPGVYEDACEEWYCEEHAHVRMEEDTKLLEKVGRKIREALRRLEVLRNAHPLLNGELSTQALPAE